MRKKDTGGPEALKKGNSENFKSYKKENMLKQQIKSSKLNKRAFQSFEDH